MTPFEALAAVATTVSFKSFDKNDWEAFAGCKSENPLIAYHRYFTIIVDGDEIILVDENGDEQIFKLEGDYFA